MGLLSRLLGVLAATEQPSRTERDSGGDMATVNRDETKRQRRWRAESDGRWLDGALEKQSDGSWRMSVEGYLTSRELRDMHGMSPALVKKFLPEHDEQAMFEDGGACMLYSTDRVRDVLNSQEYVEERKKTERRREIGRRSAKKGAAKRAARLATQRELAARAEAEARAAFGGVVYLVRCTYVYGWREYGVYARDDSHARALVDKWLRSGDGRSESTDLYEEAIDEYKSTMEDYREFKRDSVPGEKLRKPERPKKGEFKLVIGAVTKSGLDVSDYDIEEVAFESEGGGWDHDVFGDSK